MFFCVLIIRFRQFDAEKTFKNFKFFFKVVQNHMKREKKISFPSTPRIRIRMKIFAMRVKETFGETLKRCYTF